ncbi:S8 family serine peptidase [Thalassotalea psychrophila]|uniref:S8 family serine peptidase n=1 Tax=Thalassotalea psychrophila TaxID=3065647 RepID=A0ABY9TXS6_9GAMM|nr:S8 family serine peptidase [Colwelliaceae bacterium SQ149]
MTFKKLISGSLVAVYSSAVAATIMPGNNDVKLVSITAQAVVSHKERINTDFQNVSGRVNSHTHSTTTFEFDYEPDLVGTHSYIVQLNDKPLTSFDDNNSYLNANPKFSKVSNLSSPSALFSSKLDYHNHLLQNQHSVISSLNAKGVNVDVNYQLTNALNGFTIKAEQDVAQQIAQLSEVKSVTKLGFSKLQSYSLANDIGAKNIWQGKSLVNTGEYKGEGITIAILDTGINSDHISFVDQPIDESSKNVHEFPKVNTFYGLCNTGDERCNNKLIGIRSYSEVFDTVHGGVEIDEGVITSPLPIYNNAVAEGFVYRPGEDYHSHGSHVASVIAGNIIDDVNLHYPKYQYWNSSGIPLKASSYQVSGIAPNAQIISYQVCDPLANAVSCSDEAVLKAIDDAISDDVDVINFSIAKSGGAEVNPYVDPVEMAFLNAHAADIIVVTAVGNEYLMGQGDHASPWLINVGSAYKSDSYLVSTTVNEISGGDPETFPKEETFEGNVAITEYSARTGYVGDAFTGNPIVAEAKLDTSMYSDDDKQKLRYCIELPENTFEKSEIALCLATTNGNSSLLSGLNIYEAYQHMAEQAEKAGAGGMIIVGVYGTPNVTVNYINPDFPATFLGGGSGFFYDWVVTSADKGLLVNATINPLTEYFYPTVLGMMNTVNTSMGPGEGINGEYLLPSVVAPSVNVLAAAADETPYNEDGNSSDWDKFSGSSTASAVVAGAAALVKQAHPDWSPSEVISALTLTAKSAIHVNNSDKGGLPDAYTMGAGLVNVENAINTGLVMHETVDNFRSADPDLHNISALNIPAAIETACFGTCSLTRTFKATRDGSWRSQVFMDYASASTTVSPAEFTLVKGETIELTIDIVIVDESLRLGWDFDKWQGQYSDESSDIINNDGNLTGGDIVFIPDDRSIPEVHLPVVVGSRLDVVNDMHRIDIELNKGSKVLPLFTTDDVDTAEFVVYEPVISTAKETLVHAVNVRDDMSCYLYHEDACVNPLFDIEKHVADKTAHVEWIRAPEGSKRIFAEASEVGVRNLIDNRRKNSIKVAIGRDLNRNSRVEFKEEILCISDFTSAFSTNDSSVGSNNFCSLTDPIAGDYWVMYQWASGFDQQYSEFYKDELSTVIKTHTGIINSDVSKNIHISGDTFTKEVTVIWDLETEPNQTVFAAFNAIDNVKTINLNLKRANDVAVLTTNAKQNDILPGSIIDMEIDIRENLSHETQYLDLSVQLPEGSQLVGNILPDNNSHLQLTTQAISNGFKVVGTINSAASLDRDYVISTNSDNEMCRTPLVEQQDHGKYIDLGLTPITGSAMRLNEGSEEFYLLSDAAQEIVSNPRRLKADGEPETNKEWAKRVHYDQNGPFNWMATTDDSGQQYIDREHIVVDLQEVFSKSDVETPWISFYENGDFAKGRFMYVFGNGFIDFQNFASPNPLGTQTPNNNAPEGNSATVHIDFSYSGPFSGSNLSNSIAPLWRAAGHDEQFIVPFRPVQNEQGDISGISVGHVGSKLVVDYNNVKTGWKTTCVNKQLIELADGSIATQCLLNTGELDYQSNSEKKSIHSSLMEFYGNDNYDFQVFMETGESKNQPGEYEVVIAYGDITRTIFTDESLKNEDELLNNAQYNGVVGVLGHEGYKNSYGGIYHADEYYSSHNVTERTEIVNAIKPGKVVCFDYQGPGSKAGKIKFKVQLPNDLVAGDELVFGLSNSGQNTIFANQAKIVVNSSLAVSQLSNIVMAEDSATKQIAASLSDANVEVELTSTDRFIKVTSQINGSLLNISIDSEADYFTSEPATITLTVTSKDNSNQQVKASFNVEVTPVNDAPVLLYEQDSFDVLSTDFVELIALATDVDNDKLSYLWTGGHIDEDQKLNGSMSVSNLPAGSHQFDLMVTDGQVEVNKAFTVNVTQAEEESSFERKEPNGAAFIWLSLFTLLTLVGRRTLINRR